MALKYLALKDGTLKNFRYFGEHSEITEREEVKGQRFPRTKTVGHRYKLLAFDGSARHIIVNIYNPTLIVIPAGSTVELENVYVTVESQTADGRTFVRHMFIADDMKAKA